MKKILMIVIFTITIVDEYDKDRKFRSIEKIQMLSCSNSIDKESSRNFHEIGVRTEHTKKKLNLSSK